MPEQFDFSKIKDQKKFEELPKEEKDKVVTGAEEEAVVIQENIGKGKEPEVETAEKELSPEVIEKIIEKVQDINQKNTAVHVLTACFSSVPEKIQTDYTDDDRQRDKDLFKTAKTVPHYIGALKGVIKEGLLGTEYGHRYPRTTKELEEAKIRLSGTIKERWLRDVRKRGPTVVFLILLEET